MKYLQIICKIIFAFFLLFTIKTTAQPTISSFTPASGTVGTSVVISGTNFNAVYASHIVYFGAVKATVVSGTNTSLTVVVPPGVTYQPISVLDTNSGLTGYSSKPFIPTFANPFGTGISANFYKPKVDFATATNPLSVAIGDLDGDGKPDLVVANSNSNTVSVLRNTFTSGSISTSSFASKVDFASGNFTRYVAIADVDGDGKLDVVVVNNNNISVLHNIATPGNIDASSFEAKVDFDLLFTGPVAVTTADIDGDGKPELIAANSTANSVSVLRNTSTPGNISMAAKVDFAAGGTPFFISAGGLDGDGKPDLVVANASVPTNTVSVFRNTSTTGSITASSFAAKVPFTTGPIPRSVVIGDVDGDSKPDLVVTNSDVTNTTLSILRNSSTPGSITASSFATKADLTTGTSPYYVAIGDADGDSKPDIIVANQNSNTISVLRNTSTSGTISAAAKVDFTTGALPRSVAVGDLDGDGIPEIAAGNFSSNTISIFQIDLIASPVTLTNVKAYPRNNGVQIAWTAQQESNIDRYEIERSQTGQQFYKVGSVQAKGNSNVIIHYSFFDPEPFSGVNFYRIKIVEAGQGMYSQILKVNTNNSSINNVVIYPNPIKGNAISLQMNLPKGSYHVALTNKQGQQITKKVIEHPGGIATEILKLSNSLAAGVYQLRLTGRNISITRQLINK